MDLLNIKCLDVLDLVFNTKGNCNMILLHKCFHEVWRYQPHLWSSGESSWLQIQRSGFHSRRYQIFWEVVGLERGPFILVSTTEKILERRSRGSGLESREYGHSDPSRWPSGTLNSQKLSLTSLTSGCRSVVIVRSLTQATEFSFFRCRNMWLVVLGLSIILLFESCI
jgi:hypothetical protein